MSEEDDVCKQCGGLLHVECIMTFEQGRPYAVRIEPALPPHRFCSGHPVGNDAGDWERLSNEQKYAVDRERKDMCEYFIACVELFYKTHPELRLIWQFSIDAALREK